MMKAAGSGRLRARAESWFGPPDSARLDPTAAPA
jgi:hypothetical protein